MTEEHHEAPVLTRREGDVMVVTLNRPSARNALDDGLLDELLAVWTDARMPSIRAVVLTGSGPAFCAGADIHAPARGPDEIATNLRRRYNPIALAMRELPKPIIAAINGPAAGAGLSLALAADIRTASSRATFVPAFTRIGSVPDMGGSFFLTELIGYSRAYEWIISDRTLRADEALDWGLVQSVVEHEVLLADALERAQQIASVPGDAAPLLKQLLHRAASSSLAEQLEHELEAQSRAVAVPGRNAARAAVAGTLKEQA